MSWASLALALMRRQGSRRARGSDGTADSTATETGSRSAARAANGVHRGLEKGGC